ncbi:MAG: nucleotide-binding protein [bacterium]
MSNLELLYELRELIIKLKFDDNDQLDFIRRNASMLARNIFGPINDYLNDLRIAEFNGLAFFSGEYKKNQWNSGVNKLLNIVDTMINEVKLFEKSDNYKIQEETLPELTNDIFIVHGHDEEMKNNVSSVIRKIGLNPIILNEQANKGQTIIEKFEKHSNTSFAVILLSPDDKIYPPKNSTENIKVRARQNVILEVGFFLGKLGRENVLLLLNKCDNFEVPSDCDGVIYTPYNNTGQWKWDMVKELQACGYFVDANDLL